MFNSVLVTVDLDHDASWKAALPQAVELVRASGGKLHIVSVVPDFGTSLVESFFPDDFEQKALRLAADRLDGLVASEVPDDIAVKQHLAFGNIHERILDVIGKSGCDLVVMGSHAPDRLREFLVGSNADRVVRRSPVSVLVVRG